MSKRQISVPLDNELREFVEEQAAQQDRSVAGQIRHYVCEAARKIPTPTPTRRSEKSR
jgi:hypothetical protein